MSGANHGVVAAVRGSVVDVCFEQHLPPVLSVLRAGTDGQIIIEVLAPRDTRHVRGISTNRHTGPGSRNDGVGHRRPAQGTGGPGNSVAHV